MGQNVDIRGAGLEVIRRMWLEDIIRKNTTNEEGIAFVDAGNRTRAQSLVDHSGNGMNFTSCELEWVARFVGEVQWAAGR